MSAQPTPLPRVSARKYSEQSSTAKIKWRIKGNADGHVYQGQHIVIPCKGCAKTPFPLS